jgi:hypothetical protein
MGVVVLKKKNKEARDRARTRACDPRDPCDDPRDPRPRPRRSPAAKGVCRWLYVYARGAAHYSCPRKNAVYNVHFKLVFACFSGTALLIIVLACISQL